MDDQDTAPPLPGPRWWPAALICLVGVAALAMIWTREVGQRQDRILHSVQALMWVGGLLGLWLLLLSRLRWRVRFAALGLLCLLAAVGYSAIKVTGVSGDLEPLVGWRWSDPEARRGRLTQANADAPWAQTPTATVAARASPQFRGPDRDGVIRGVALLEDWTVRPPHEVWRRPVGPAWSGFAVAGEHAVTQEQHGPEERIVCYALRTGQQRWAHRDRTRYATRIGGIGPRATPTIADERVYAYGATGRLTCLALASGKRLWQRDVLGQTGAAAVQWGCAGSPLIVDRLVIVSSGGKRGPSLLAYDRRTGEPVWQAGKDCAGYSSPRLAMVAGRRQVLIFNKGNLVGHDPRTGAVLWEQAWQGGGECVAMPLVLSGDRILVSTGYGVGARMFKLDPPLVSRQLWRARRLRAKFTNLVQREGHVYGLSDGVLSCFRLADGQRSWRGARYGHGQLLRVGPLLLVQSEKGPLALVRATPQGATELGRLPALAHKTWNPPTLAAPFLLLRNSKEAVCYRLPLSAD